MVAFVSLVYGMEGCFPALHGGEAPDTATRSGRKGQGASVGEGRLVGGRGLCTHQAPGRPVTQPPHWPHRSDPSGPWEPAPCGPGFPCSLTGLGTSPPVRGHSGSGPRSLGETRVRICVNLQYPRGVFSQGLGASALTLHWGTSSPVLATGPRLCPQVGSTPGSCPSDSSPGSQGAVRSAGPAGPISLTPGASLAALRGSCPCAPCFDRLVLPCALFFFFHF